MKSLIVAIVVAGVWSVSGSLALAQDSFDEDSQVVQEGRQITKEAARRRQHGPDGRRGSAILADL